MTSRRPTISRRPFRAGWCTAGALLLAAAVSGCGASSGELSGMSIPPAEPPPAPEPVSASAQQPETGSTPVTEDDAEQPARPTDETTRCHTSMLSGTVEEGDAGAGQRYAELVLRNSSGQTCTLYGYGGLELIGQDGAPLPTDLERVPNPGPALITLSPGETASATLHWTAVPHGGEPVDQPCQPTPARLAVIPPDETDSLRVDWPFGPVCGFGSMDGTAYHQ